MPVLIATFLIIGLNWLISGVVSVQALALLRGLGTVGWWVIGLLGLGAIAWCFGDDP
ncbi:hypothetical protein PN441_02855 [Spirulina major CS-329]|jgi:hypothetical protein|uniref:hypothetical protein n=1 Tax=Spirulina TaxID=1154 RepID=UPI002330514E|nr:MULTISPECIES: hypothetical protein [Spirulina]MDB9495728.1 hypothetical protein [Spirulina subsalsa CS-330]MDB9501996.1 hypothetical protein [Spirulina major CS-329]